MNILQKSINNILDFLEKSGKKIIENAQNSKDVGNDTFNQHDAYGAAVYYNGELKRFASLDSKSIRDHHGSTYYNIPAGTGEEWADMFLKEYEPPKKGFALVCFNAAYYSVIQETYTYRIISQEYTDMEKILKHFPKRSGRIEVL